MLHNMPVSLIMNKIILGTDNLNCESEMNICYSECLKFATNIYVLSYSLEMLLERL